MLQVQIKLYKPQFLCGGSSADTIVASSFFAGSQRQSIHNGKGHVFWNG